MQAVGQLAVDFYTVILKFNISSFRKIWCLCLDSSFIYPFRGSEEEKLFFLLFKDGIQIESLFFSILVEI